MFRVFRAAIAIILATSTATFAVTVGQVDDFQDGTVMNWIEGGASPNPPVYVADQGPMGAGDGAMFDLSTGTLGPGGRAVILNRTQWGGDYLSAGVTGITAYARASVNSEPLSLRVGFESVSSRYVSIDAVTIPNDDRWYPVSFEISAADLTQVGGAESYETVMASVDEFRLISSAGAAWQGDVAFTEIYIDNVTAIPEPSGILLLVVAGVTLFARRR